MSAISFTHIKQLTYGEDNNIEAIITTYGNEDAVGDVVDPGALDDYIERFNNGEAGVLRMLYQHDRTMIVGQWNELVSTPTGVVAKGEIFEDVSLGKDVRTLIKRGVLGSVSIGFRSNEYEYLEDGGRLFKEIELVEVSIVDVPANDRAIITDIKSEDGSINLRVLEKCLREAGLSRTEATKVASVCKTEMSNVREEQDNDQQLLDALSSFTTQIGE